MGSLSSWSPYQKHVQGGMRVGDYVSGQFVLIAAGPPFLANVGGGGLGGSVYPIGLTQNIAMGQNKLITRIFEIGSNRSYFIAGRDMGQLSLARVWFSGGSLLRCLWSYYDDSTSGNFPNVRNLIGNNTSFFGLEKPYLAGETDGDTPLISEHLHDVEVPPGFNNMYLNLASDLFNQPMGLFLLFVTSDRQPVGAVYLEQCYVPSHNWGLDTQGLVFQESVGIQFERVTPVNIRSVSLLRGLIDGNYAAPQNELLNI